MAFRFPLVLGRHYKKRITKSTLFLWINFEKENWGGLSKFFYSVIPMFCKEFCNSEDIATSHKNWLCCSQLSELPHEESKQGSLPSLHLFRSCLKCSVWVLQFTLRRLQDRSSRPIPLWQVLILKCPSRLPQNKLPHHSRCDQALLN